MPESLRLFALCQALEWAVLPVAGGLYDQHPELIKQWSWILEIKGEHEKREQDKREAEARRPPRRR